ncbi:DinB family protein [Nocardia yamanashiensis]|uniref:DinB family protein n=1 Tax=Nocardia yamanashiensis TaxID=209247 RepID=UPI00082A53D8|nr:DinB family protein [Nocardia yamanashiensis]
MTVDRSREDLIDLLAEQREIFRITLRGLDEDQARQRSTVSELTLGGLLHHVINTERHWTQVIVDRDENAEFDVSGMDTEYRMGPDETLEGLLAEWETVIARTTELIRGLDSLDESIPIPTAPWSPERMWWTARFILLHILREISHHSGHADIIRESLDGANTTYQRA